MGFAALTGLWAFLAHREESLRIDRPARTKEIEAFEQRVQANRVEAFYRRAFLKVAGLPKALEKRVSGERVEGLTKGER